MMKGHFGNWKKKFSSDKKPFLVSHINYSVTIWYNMNFHFDSLKNTKIIIILKQAIIQIRHHE